MHDVLIVGASAGGLTVAEGLRARGFDGTIALVDDDPSPLHDRPPLSKQVLSGLWTPEQSRLRRPEEIEALELELVPARAASVDPVARRLQLADGGALDYAVLVAATGLKPRMPADWSGLPGVHTMHTISDSLALRADLATARDVVVVGAGVLGSEIAATARTLGARVTLVEELGVPMKQAVGHLVGNRLRELHESRGVRVVTARVADLTSSDAGRVTGVVVDGRSIAADVVVVALGGAPQTDWLLGVSGVSVSDGVECDQCCRAADGIFAVGDVARWYHAGLGASVRLENRTNATEQGRLVAGNILGDHRAYTPIPYFWTDQYDVKLQVFGRIGVDSVVEPLEGDLADDRFVAVARTGDVVDAVICWNHFRGARQARALLVDRYSSLAGIAAT